eukprot:g14236.t1
MVLTFSMIGMYRLDRAKFDALVKPARTAIVWSFNICFAIPAPLLSLLINVPAGAQFCSTLLASYAIIMSWSLGWSQIRMLMLKDQQNKLGKGVRLKFLVGLTVFVFAFVACPMGVLVGIFVGNFVLEQNASGMLYNIFQGSEGIVAGQTFAVVAFGLIQAIYCFVFRRRFITILNGLSKSGFASLRKGKNKVSQIVCIAVVWIVVLPVSTLLSGCLTDPYAANLVGSKDLLEIAYIRETLFAILFFVVSLLLYFEMYMKYLQNALPVKVQVIAFVSFLIFFATPASLLIRLHRVQVAVRILVTMVAVGVQGVIWFSLPSTRDGPHIIYVIAKSVEYILLIAIPLSILLGY